ncbi:Ligand-binding domain of nuclear hormone receptor [Necator americanus]|uniref:Ligand-binding domain of nuclear hormone receptor n=1 Tax=Necator americanus TaxID=51031 RepID=W2TP70_NECAM|nr:Ligand-binding domain of nuclear hormone receptor [Necator americanus]ETN83578.1 Ligand-binding domain of nuclear hormone receptor [Necator americanus]
MDGMKNDSICHICGSLGAQIHYRAMACGTSLFMGFRSCKVFFVRTIQRSVPFVCDNNGRDKKCLQGVSFLEVSPSEYDRKRCLHAQNLLFTASSIYFKFTFNYYYDKIRTGVVQRKENELYDAVSVGIHFVYDLQKTPRALDYARTLVHIEKLCENPGARRTNFDYSVDMSLAEALRKPHLCCARTPIGWNQDEFVETENLLDTLKQIYCRTVTLFADFASGCPELALLEEQDKLVVCSKNYCGCVLFTLAYNAYLNDYYGILFPHGFKFDEFLQTLFDYLHSNVVRVFRETGITTEEYTFVKTLILFSGAMFYQNFPVIPLTDAGLSIVLRARRKYAALLSELITTTRPELSSVEAMNRLTRLFSLIPHMMVR